MALLKKDVPAPMLPDQRVVSVPELGGEVIVRPLLLSDRLALAREARVNDKPKDFGHIASLLTHAVVDAEGEQLFTTAQWEAWGSLHMLAALSLWDAAWSMSGLDTDAAEKNSQAQSSSSQ